MTDPKRTPVEAVIEAARARRGDHHSPDCDVFDFQIAKPCNCGEHNLIVALEALSTPSLPAPAATATAASNEHEECNRRHWERVGVAIAEEREMCARVAEGMGRPDDDGNVITFPSEVADAIRARGKAEPTPPTPPAPAAPTDAQEGESTWQVRS